MFYEFAAVCVFLLLSAAQTHFESWQTAITLHSPALLPRRLSQPYFIVSIHDQRWYKSFTAPLFVSCTVFTPLKNHPIASQNKAQTRARRTERQKIDFTKQIGLDRSLGSLLDSTYHYKESVDFIVLAIGYRITTVWFPTNLTFTIHHSLPIATQRTPLGK